MLSSGAEELGLAGTVNTSELPINVVTFANSERRWHAMAKMARGIVNGCMVPVTWITIPPAKRQNLTRPVKQAELGKPALFPPSGG